MWYQQELLQTFGGDLGEVALQPGASGEFAVEVQAAEGDAVVVWSRVEDGGFPDSKALKQRVRAVLFPDRSLGHVDGAAGVLVGNTCKECGD